MQFVREAVCLEKYPKRLGSGLEVLPCKIFWKNYGPLESAFENLLKYRLLNVIIELDSFIYRILCIYV